LSFHGLIRGVENGGGVQRRRIFAQSVDAHFGTVQGVESGTWFGGKMNTMRTPTHEAHGEAAHMHREFLVPLATD